MASSLLVTCDKKYIACKYIIITSFQSNGKSDLRPKKNGRGPQKNTCDKSAKSCFLLKVQYSYCYILHWVFIDKHYWNTFIHE